MNLPTELHARIFEQLKLNDRITISNVSSLFNELNNGVEYQDQVTLIRSTVLPKYIVTVKCLSASNIQLLNFSPQIKHLNLNEMMDYDDLNQLKLPHLQSLSFDTITIETEEITIARDIKSFAELKKLSLSFHENSEYHLEFLQALSHLDSIEIEFIDCINDKDLENLSRVENLRKLVLIGNNISCEGLSHLKNFKNLDTLYIQGVDQEELKTLGKLKIKKFKLELDNFQIKAFIDLDYFQGLKNLESLSLGIFEERDFNQLIKLKRFDKLIRLKISVYEFNSELVSSLNELTNIKHLSLVIIQADIAEYLNDLLKINNLESLEIDNCDVVVDILLKMKSLKRLIMNDVCEIEYDLLVKSLENSNIKELTFWEYHDEINTIDSLRKHFPNIKIKNENFEVGPSIIRLK